MGALDNLTQEQAKQVLGMIGDRSIDQLSQDEAKNVLNTIDSFTAQKAPAPSWLGTAAHYATMGAVPEYAFGADDPKSGPIDNPKEFGGDVAEFAGNTAGALATTALGSATGFSAGGVGAIPGTIVGAASGLAGTKTGELARRGYNAAMEAVGGFSPEERQRADRLANKSLGDYLVGAGLGGLGQGISGFINGRRAALTAKDAAAQLAADAANAANPGALVGTLTKGSLTNADIATANYMKDAKMPIPGIPGALRSREQVISQDLMGELMDGIDVSNKTTQLPKFIQNISSAKEAHLAAKDGLIGQAETALTQLGNSRVVPIINNQATGEALGLGKLYAGPSQVGGYVSKVTPTEAAEYVKTLDDKIEQVGGYIRTLRSATDPKPESIALQETIQNGYRDARRQISAALNDTINELRIAPPDQLMRHNQAVSSLIPLGQIVNDTGAKIQSLVNPITKGAVEVGKSEAIPNGIVGVVNKGVEATTASDEALLRTSAARQKDAVLFNYALRSFKNTADIRNGMPPKLPRDWSLFKSSPQNLQLAGVLALQAGMVQNPEEFQAAPEPIQKQMVGQLAQSTPSYFDATPFGFRTLIDSKFADSPQGMMERESYRKMVYDKEMPIGEKAAILNALNKNEFVPFEADRIVEELIKPTANSSDLIKALGGVSSGEQNISSQMTETDRMIAQMNSQNSNIDGARSGYN